jgi:hydrogenase/urease accessory protein HupE
MAQKEKSGDDIAIPILILFVFTLIGGFAFGMFSTSYYTQYNGYFIGFLVGVAVLLTVEYASNKIRESNGTPLVSHPGLARANWTEQS